MKKKKALLTGITGQDGSYLAEFLLEKGYEVHGLVRRASTFNRGRIEHLMPDIHQAQHRIVLHYGDLSDAGSLHRVIRDLRPDEAYHLGAQSHVRISFDIPDFTGDTTGLGTTRLLEVIRHDSPHTRFYQASSSEMFGSAPSPQNERTLFHPRSPYGVAKLYAYWMTVNYRDGYNLHASNGILFNHESPRRGENFVTRKVAIGLVRIKQGILDTLYMGNLDARRDWGYAPDYVKAMWLMLQQEKPDDYVIATGETHTVREFIEEASRLLGFDVVWEGTGVGQRGIDRTSGKTIIAVDPMYFRPTEVDVLMGDASKAKEKLGWEPRVMFKDLVKIMIEAEVNGGAIR